MWETFGGRIGEHHQGIERIGSRRVDVFVSLSFQICCHAPLRRLKDRIRSLRRYEFGFYRVVHEYKVASPYLTFICHATTAAIADGPTTRLNDTDHAFTPSWNEMHSDRRDQIGQVLQRPLLATQLQRQAAFV